MEGSDASAFDAFVARRHAALVRTAFLLVGDRQLAEDLVQTALYRTFRALKSLRSIDAVEAYTRTTMVRLALRWRMRRWNGETPSGALPERAVDDPADVLASGLDVYRALMTLPRAQRAVLVLRYFEDLSEADTAEVLRCSVGTVRSRTSCGKASLRVALAPERPQVEEAQP